MKKKLYKSGNAWALLIQKAILQLLDIDPENDEVELEVENKVLKVKKVTKKAILFLPVLSTINHLLLAGSKIQKSVQVFT